MPIKKPRYIRKETYPVDAVLPYLGDYRKEYDGDLIGMGSLRYITFKKNACKCVFCGIEGTFFAKETFNSNQKIISYHFNLYGIRSGREVMLTKDHIHPKSHGGLNDVGNLQTMCESCNTRKGNMSNEEFMGLRVAG